MFSPFLIKIFKKFLTYKKIYKFYFILYFFSFIFDKFQNFITKSSHHIIDYYGWTFIYTKLKDKIRKWILRTHWTTFFNSYSLLRKKKYITRKIIILYLIYTHRHTILILTQLILKYLIIIFAFKYSFVFTNNTTCYSYLN